jgi:hypothetical protein
MATKSTPPREQNNHVINSLSVGWGASSHICSITFRDSKQ